MVALFVMTVTTVMVVSILDTETLQYGSLRNTMDYDRARYLAEAGLQHAYAMLEQDWDWRAGLNRVAFPPGSSDRFSVTLTDGPEGTLILTSTGESGDFVRRLQTRIKQGG
ncbi:MAG: type II secretory pathway component PulK [Pirellulaceae bacterium]|jgi:type II secretory pathway component PulK